MKLFVFKILAISVLIAGITGCSKESNIENKSRDNEKQSEIKKQINTFSNLLDKKIKTASFTKVAGPAPTTPSEFEDAIEDVIETELPEIEPQYLWLRDDVELQTESIGYNLPNLYEATNELQAVNIIESNLYNTIDFSNSIDITDPAIKTNLNTLEESIVDAIKDDVKNAFLLDDNNMTEAQSEMLAEQVNATLKTKVTSTIQNRIQSINAFPQGLTSQQASMVSMSLMASVSTINDLVLMENLDAVITADIFSVPDVPAIPTKGLFGKIGKFFGKVIKSVAVVVASAAVIVVGAVLGYIASEAHYSNPNHSGNSDYTALTGALVGVGIVAKQSKKWWGWVGWDRW